MIRENYITQEPNFRRISWQEADREEMEAAEDRGLIGAEADVKLPEE